MITQTIASKSRPVEQERSGAKGLGKRILGQAVRRSWLYQIAAELNLIVRWFALKLISQAWQLLPGDRSRRDRRIIELGNRLFPAMFPSEMYANFESYVVMTSSGLDHYLNLLPEEDWLAGCKILDLGSGLGQYSQELIDCGAAGVTGLEYQQNKAQWSSARSNSPNLRFVTGSAEAIPFAEGTFDTVFSHTVFEHIQDVAKSLSEVRRVLKPGGVALISYNYFHHRGGHHLFPYIHFPWATWIVKESSLCDYWSERLCEDQAQGLMGFYGKGARIRSLSEGAEIHLNRLRFDQFESLVRKAGLRIERRRSSEVLAQLFPWLTKVPKLKYFLAGTYYYVLAREPQQGN